MVDSNITPTDITLFAHRGFAGVAPENTLTAARRAGRFGADVIECDVVATADGTPVVFHDRRLDDHRSSRGITDATGAVDEQSVETVTNANVLGTSQHIPQLSAFVDAVPDEVGLNIELKHPDTASIEGAPDNESHRDQWRPLVCRVLDTLDRNSDTVLFSSFSESALETVRSASTDAQIAPIAWDLDTAVTMADALDTEIIHPSIDGLRSAESRSLRDYTVNAWTAKTWQDARDAAQYGVDGVIADYPNLLSTVTGKKSEP